MEIGERIKIVRDEIGLTQSDFASKIGIGQAALSALEKGVRSVTDRNIDLICREYSVSPDWLRTGEGDMFVQSDDSLFDRFIDENGLDALDAAIIRAFVKLPAASRHAVASAVRQMARECAAASNDYDAAIDIIEDKLAKNGIK